MALNNFALTSNQLGPFVLLEMIDKGGMALVYKARDERDNAIVALKLMHPFLMTDPESVKRFQREAKIATHFEHPHIVTLRDFGEIDGHFYLSMRYMAGGNLLRHFRSTAPFELEKTLKVLRQVASALDYAHERGIVHRDLKLENILLDENGDCALGDFGIARVIDGTRYTVTGQITGTPHYMSPEQARGVRDIDYRSDLYSFAVMAFRIATGKFPFLADDPLSVLNQHVQDIPPTPTLINPTLPRELDYVLWQGLSKLPEHRYPSASSFVDAFRHAFDAPIVTPRDLMSDGAQLQTQDAVRTSVMEVEEVVDAPSNRRRALIFAFIVLILVLGMGLFVTRAFVLATFGVPLSVVTPTTDGAGSLNDAVASPTNDALFVVITGTGEVAEVIVTGNASATFTRTPMMFATNTLRPSSTSVPATTAVPASHTPQPTNTSSAAVTNPRATNVPPTNVPPTSVPPTSMPPTSVPPTAVPPTNVPPPTSVPPTNPPPPTQEPLLPIIPTVIELIPTLVPLPLPLFP